MKQFILIFLLISFGMACKRGAKKPDISEIKVELKVRRFEKDFFKSNALNIDAQIVILNKNYPFFYNDFIEKIVGLNPTDSAVLKAGIKKFTTDYQPVFDSTLIIESGIQKAISELKEGLRYVKYYFPEYQLPDEFITFIGPMDAFVNSTLGGQAEIITSNALCSGLQLHLGANSSFYSSGPGQQLYPEYISRKFTTDYIAVNCLRNIVDDIYMPKHDAKNLLEIMIDHGKRMYLLDLFLPDTNDEIKIGYTTQQLKGAFDNEALIWNFFTENNLLYETDFLKIRSYISEGPSTPELGIESPGFISLFTGRQIIRKYMEKNPNIQLKDLLATDAAKILSVSKYRPR